MLKSKASDHLDQLRLMTLEYNHCQNLMYSSLLKTDRLSKGTLRNFQTLA